MLVNRAKIYLTDIYIYSDYFELYNFFFKKKILNCPFFILVFFVILGAKVEHYNSNGRLVWKIQTKLKLQIR
jgi:hypothetical protein